MSGGSNVSFALLRVVAVDLNGLRDALRRQPFKPFTIRLADGRSLPVGHPEMVAVGQRRAVVIQDDDGCLWLEPLLVVSIDWPGEPRKPEEGDGTRGTKKPRRGPQVGD
jgi:hypothetical protein